MNTINLWNNFLENIKKQVNSMAYTTWFSETKLFELNDNKAKVIVPMHIHKKHLQEHYIDIINETFNNITGSNWEFEFLLEEEIEKKSELKEENTGVPYNNPEKANLNNKYLFENFIVGDSNKFANTAAMSVAENPGKMYNPLFIYGSSGLGKTHLMHAIGNYIVKNSNRKVLYVTSEQFIEDFLNVCKRDNSGGNNFNTIDIFKDKYRNIDVLIIDDIQFLAGAPQTQQEFFHTFNSLHEENKQIIISSDRSPDDLKILEDRLRTRFTWGLSVPIFSPDFDLRKQILKKKIANQNLTNPISNEIIDYIASNCDSDIRQLEGALTRVIAYATMFNKDSISLDIAVEALKDYLNKSVSIKNNIQKIQKSVADYYKISLEDLKSKKRLANIAFPRQVAMYLSRILTDESYPKIGMEFGGKDHSTVMHSYEKIEQELKNNYQLREVIEILKNEVN